MVTAPTGHASDDDPALLARAGIDRAAIHCNRDNRWGNAVKPDSKDAAKDAMALLGPKLLPLDEPARAALEKKLESLFFWRMVRATLIEGDNNNFGVVALRDHDYVDESGHTRPVLLFRTGFTPHPDASGSCFESLLQAGGVRHVVNLFDGDIPAADLVAAESHAASTAGASYCSATDAGETPNASSATTGYGTWRDTLRKHADDPTQYAEAMRSVARLIREQILRPGGAPPRGNIHIHCGGGMHRTGMIVGIVERCVNQESDETVAAHYRYHVGWKSESVPGGYEAGNLQFIRDFDCGLLR